jgi:sugar lactone lactonase YvrE
MKRRTLFLIPGAFLALGVAYLLLWPTPIDPQAWTPAPAPPLAGDYAPNAKLAAAKRIAPSAFIGAEDVAIDAEGRIYGGLPDGRILRTDANRQGTETFVNTGGHPLGLKFDRTGNLIVCDSFKGLLSVAPSGEVTTLSVEADGTPFKFTDDLDIAADGTIYFTDASFKFAQPEYPLDFLEHRPNGRLLAYDPATKTTRVVLKDLYFANGVAVSPDQSFVLVNETSSYRIRRYWLAGPDKGRTDLFADNLPGFPDGISSNGKDIFWVALFGPRNALFDRILQYPTLRKVYARLPAAAQGAGANYGFALGLTIEGKVAHNLQDPSPEAFAPVTNVVEHDGTLYFGSLSADGIAYLSVPR